MLGREQQREILKAEHIVHILRLPPHGSSERRAEESEMKEFESGMKWGWGERVLIFAFAPHYLNLFSLAIH